MNTIMRLAALFALSAAIFGVAYGQAITTESTPMGSGPVPVISAKVILDPRPDLVHAPQTPGYVEPVPMPAWWGTTRNVFPDENEPMLPPPPTVPSQEAARPTQKMPGLPPYPGDNDFSNNDLLLRWRVSRVSNTTVYGTGIESGFAPAPITTAAPWPAWPTELVPPLPPFPCKCDKNPQDPCCTYVLPPFKINNDAIDIEMRALNQMKQATSKSSKPPGASNSTSTPSSVYSEPERSNDYSLGMTSVLTTVKAETAPPPPPPRPQAHAEAASTSEPSLSGLPPDPDTLMRAETPAAAEDPNALTKDEARAAMEMV
eukprot:gnl/Spiro4/2443_TR1173_c0_g1_i1.p1 gnl/Spiro4/2443_TR1173_c0_g1~~gnl/Spiro4/2443_TR1173_c0_g1_i1.p1  ORF type:complete len:316 (+),score=97.84 gnl/Spiro4/2443_TR1173_c0_g1_i1:51-998(+)